MCKNSCISTFWLCLIFISCSGVVMLVVDAASLLFSSRESYGGLVFVSVMVVFLWVGFDYLVFCSVCVICGF